MNRKALFALCASVALAAPAMAGGSYDWAGWYAGINLGGGGGNFGMPVAGTFNAPPNSYDLNGKVSLNGIGFVGGGQIGYNYVFPQGWMVGVETDAQATTINPELRDGGPLGGVGTYGLTVGSKIDFFGTARARLGYVIPEKNVLLFGTAGFAYGDVGVNATLDARNATDNAFATLDRHAIDVGWTVGAGVEYPVSNRITLRAEYLYVDLGSNKLLDYQITTPSLTGSGNIKIDTNAHIGRVALNYAL